MIIFHEVSGVNIACWKNNRDDDAGKKHLLFIHGSGGDHRIWTKQYSKLKDDFNITAIDLPGHGLSEGPGEEDVTQYAEWVKKFINSLPLKKPVLIGHSLGAAISLVCAIQYGDMLAGIVPVGGGAKMPVNDLILKGLKTDPDFVIDLITKFAVARENRERMSRTLIEGLSPVKPGILYGDFLACNKLDISDRISQISLPTLVICGTEDKMTPPALSQFLGDSIPGAQLSFIENAGHMVMMENAESFNRLLKTFVESLPAE